MDQKKLDAMAEELAKDVKTPADLASLSAFLTKLTVVNKHIYLVLGINVEGRKERLRVWMSENEDSKFWLPILTDLKNEACNTCLSLV